MFYLLYAGISLVVIRILAIFNPGAFLSTIGSGLNVDAIFTALPWKNPFSKTSILQFADAFVALQADLVIPAVLPGATSVGRPYIVEKIYNFSNLTQADSTGTPSMHVTIPPNLTFPTVLSNLHHGPSVDNVLVSAAWNISLTLVFVLLLMLAFLAIVNSSFRTAAAVQTKFLDGILTIFSKLSKITGENDPDMSKLLRGIIGDVQKQEVVVDPYKLDLSESQIIPLPPVILSPLPSMPGRP